MVGPKFFKKVAATVAVTGMVLTGIAGLVDAATIVKNGETVNGYIRSGSPSFTFRNQSLRGTPTQRAYGEEFIFNANQGNSLVATVEVEDGSTLVPILVLVSPNGTQVAFDDRNALLRYRVPTTGQYKLRVLGKNNTLGRYTVSVAGISQTTTSQTPSTTTPSTQTDSRRKFLEDEYGLRVLDNCPSSRSSLVVAYFREYGQTYTYCANPNRLLKAGEYTYDVASNELRPGNSSAQTPTGTTTPQTDQRRQFLQDEYGLRVLDTCPATKTGVVVANFTEYGKTYTYCANPNRALRAGEYVYNPASNELEPGSPTAQNPGTSTTNTPADNERRKLLQSEFGLTVLNTCPSSTASLVVVNFPQGGQNYTYCANPNRIFAAGQYTYNATTRNLEVARKTPQCTVSVGGICIVK